MNGTDARLPRGDAPQATESVEGALEAASPIDFPATLSVKAMGLNEPDFEPLVRDLVAPHVGALEADAITRLTSRNGKYVSVRVRFTATSRGQLETIYRALHAEPRVLFTL